MPHARGAAGVVSVSFSVVGWLQTFEQSRGDDSFSGHGSGNLFVRARIDRGGPYGAWKGMCGEGVMAHQWVGGQMWHSRVQTEAGGAAVGVEGLWCTEWDLLQQNTIYIIWKARRNLLWRNSGRRLRHWRILFSAVSTAACGGEQFSFFVFDVFDVVYSSVLYWRPTRETYLALLKYGFPSSSKRRTIGSFMAASCSAVNWGEIVTS